MSAPPRARRPVAHRPAARLLLLVLGAGGAVAACRKGEAPSGDKVEAAKEAAAPDRFQDGKAIAAERLSWKRAWSAVKAPPDCAELEAELRARCDDVQRTLAVLQRIELADGPDAEVLAAATELAAAALELRAHLQNRSLQHLFRAARASASASAAAGEGSPPAAASGGPPDRAPGVASAAGAGSAPASARGARAAAPGGASAAARASAPPAPSSVPGAPSGAHAGESAEEHEEHGHGAGPRPPGEADNPWTTAFRAHDAMVTLAVARLSAYLSIAPLPLRQRALAAMRPLVERHAGVSQVRRAITEAALEESDRALRKELGALRDAVRKAPPAIEVKQP